MKLFALLSVLSVFSVPLVAAEYQATVPATTTAWDDLNWAGGEGVPGPGDTARVRGGAGAGATNLRLGRDVTVEQLEAYATHVRLRSSSAVAETLTITDVLRVTGTSQTQLHLYGVGNNGMLTVNSQNLAVDSGTTLILRRDANASLVLNIAGNSTNDGTIGVMTSFQDISLGHLTNNGLLDMASSAAAAGLSYEIRVASLQGNSNGVVTNQFDAGTTTLRIEGTNSASALYAGVIEDRRGDAATVNTAVIKDGSGRQVFSGANTYSGGTEVNAGALLVNNTTGSGIGRGNVVVHSGATFGGSGRVELSAGNTITVRNGGNLQVGDDTGFGQLNLHVTDPALLIMEEGAEFTFKLGTGGQSDTLAFHSYEEGALVLNNNRINVTGIQAGDFKLFEFDAPITALSQELQLGEGFDGWEHLVSLDYRESSIYLTVIPEPGSYAAGIGLILIGALVYRNRKAKALN